MNVQNPDPVVVAVGHDPMDAALAYAAGEASRAGCGLHLLHVVHHVPQGPETVLVHTVDLEHVGRSALNIAAELAADLVAEDVPITTELVWGGVVTSILHRVADDARTVVLQRRSLSRLHRVVNRSVSSGVAAHAPVPVVAVPESWSPVGSTGDVPTVTVGVDVPDRSEHLLRVAARAAASRGARLRVLHTWTFPGAYDDLIMSITEEGARWAKRARTEIQAVLDEIEDDLAGADVEIVTRHAFATDALIEAGHSSELLVVGRHDVLVPLGSQLGPVARAVLREATCPVLLADPQSATNWFARHLRAQGEGA